MALHRFWKIQRFNNKRYYRIKEKQKIKALLAEELGVNADEITAETSFKEDLGADSLDLFELVTNLEEEYNIEIPAEQLEEMTTVGKVIDYLKSIHIEA